MRYEVRRPVTYFFYWNTPIAATALKNGPSPLPEVLSTNERALKREGGGGPARFYDQSAGKLSASSSPGRGLPLDSSPRSAILLPF